MTIHPNLKSFKKTCETLDISRASLHHIVHLNQIGKYAHSETQRFNEMCLSFNLRKQEISQCARNMACWKRDKPKLLKQIEQAKQHLQLDLFHDNASNPSH